MWDRDLRGPARRTSGAPSYWPAGTFPGCRPEERLHFAACLPEGGCHRAESHVRSRSSVDLEISAKLACLQRSAKWLLQDTHAVHALVDRLAAEPNLLIPLGDAAEPQVVDAYRIEGFGK